MRRFKQQLPHEEAKRLLMSATSGVLAVSGDNGYPYAIPISYVYANGKNYFHLALTGHKIDVIRQNPKVPFCVINQDEIVPQEFTTYFKSVITFGKERIIEDETEKMKTLSLLAARYSDDTITPQMTDKEIAGGIKRLLMVEVRLASLSYRIWIMDYGSDSLCDIPHHLLCTDVAADFILRLRVLNIFRLYMLLWSCR